MNEHVVQPLRDRVLPPTGYVKPIGPSNFPQQLAPQPDTPLAKLNQIEQLLKNLMDKNAARAALMRGRNITAAGQTLDWSMHGQMERVMIRNRGADICFFAFDTDGTNVPAQTGDGSFGIQAQEAITINNVLFQKIGFRCATGDTAIVEAIAFKRAFGDFGGSIV